MCEKKALLRTRRVLDAFADRIGAKTWQTVISEEGLLAVKQLLRKSASKNTAVACHWRRSYNRTDLMWIVGNKNKFNAEGIVPVNWTKKDILNSEWENDWQLLPIIKAFTALAALLHDWGKASDCFQEKLNKDSKNKYKGDPLRHEWISTLIFTAFVCDTQESIDEEDWLERLANGEINENTLKKSLLQNIEEPFRKLPAIATLLAWLILSHHRLPTPKKDSQEERFLKTGEFSLKQIRSNFSYENKYDESDFKNRLSDCLNFKNGLLSESSKWLKDVKKWAGKLSEAKGLLTDANIRIVLSHARLSLMLADHFYSSQNSDRKWGKAKLFANTDGNGDLKQSLDEHLVNVAKNALQINHLLPRFERELESVDNNKNLQKKSPQAFKWQDKAVSEIKKWKEDLTKNIEFKNQYAFFAINMASTGTGKTFANAKVMQALSPKENNLRFNLALGLQTLTLQTGDEYKAKIGLDESELAVLIGSKSISQLHNLKNDQKTSQEENSGSESSESVFDDDIIYDSPIPDTVLTTLFSKNLKAKKFLYAPVVVSTIDHLMPATETVRGGRYILPQLRLMSSDLVIDEIDDFNREDLIAIGRLIHLTAMLGRKVMISSATIPPDLAEGFFHAYKEGWKIFAESRGRKTSIAVAWIDEFNTRVRTINTNETSISNFQTNHNKFILNRIRNLVSSEEKFGVRRKGIILSCDNIQTNIEENYFKTIKNTCLNLHKIHNTIDSKSTKKISFGVVRIANIDPCIRLFEYLRDCKQEQDIDLRVMAYHSRQVMLLRSDQEKYLDSVLHRKSEGENNIIEFKDPIIRNHIDNSNSKNIAFILVATPVEEVGRDHDFDWAVIEPSSFRSIIQLAGRVLRHRNKKIAHANIAILEKNLKALQQQTYPYSKPGFETDSFEFSDKSLTTLLQDTNIERSINACPRISKKSNPNLTERFADLEHAVMKDALTNYSVSSVSSFEGWLVNHWYFFGLAQHLNKFRKSEKSRNYFLKYDNGSSSFIELNENNEIQNCEFNIQHNEELKDNKHLWFQRNYENSLKELSASFNLSLSALSLRFGEISIKESQRDVSFEYSDQFGLKKLARSKPS
jgi:CRISPR-associated endonuclease/helicase Cas3